MPKQLQLQGLVKVVEAPTVNFKKVLDNLQYRQHPERMSDNKQDLDVYVHRMVEDKIGPGGFHNFKEYF